MIKFQIKVFLIRQFSFIYLGLYCINISHYHRACYAYKLLTKRSCAESARGKYSYYKRPIRVQDWHASTETIGRPTCLIGELSETWPCFSSTINPILMKFRSTGDRTFLLHYIPRLDHTRHEVVLHQLPPGGEGWGSGKPLTSVGVVRKSTPFPPGPKISFQKPLIRSVGVP